MTRIGDHFQTADWKSEKHVPVIECEDTVEADQIFEVKVGIGKEVAHPNKTEHHIRWVQLFFKPQGEKAVYQVGNFEFTAHGESVEGADKGPIHSHHSVKAFLKLQKSGVLLATSFCNIHGLWENSKEISVR